MKFGQLIEYNMRKNFLGKSYTNAHTHAVEMLFPDPLLKKQNRAYLWINSFEFYTGYFYYMSCRV